MKSKLILSIAKSLLLARWRQTLVAAIGVTFGITMFVTLLSFMTGLNKLLDGLIMNRTPHIRLFREIRPNHTQPIQLAYGSSNQYHFVSSLKSGNARLEIFNSDFIMQSLLKDERVEGIAPRVTTQVFFNYGSIDINGIVNGVEVESESRLFSFTDYMVGGNAADLGNISNSIILGKGLAEKMQAAIGDAVTITTSKGDRYTLKVVGFFQSGINEIDKVQSYASVSTAQKLLNKTGSYVTDIGIRLKQPTLAPEVAADFAKRYECDAEDIQTANAQFETGTRVRNIISYAVGITLLIVAGFGIYNILNMMIYEKMDSIAILKATGFSGKDVNRIFLSISMGIGLFGGISGLVFGFLLSKGINQIPFNTSALPTVKTFPINYNPIYYIIGISFSLITTYFAGFFPARKASRIDPVVIIRGK